MKKILFVCCLSIAVFALLTSCGKTDSGGCQPASVSSEKSAMVAFCTTNNITYTEHSSGILYQIINPGSGVAPTVSSSVSAVYTGQLLNGNVFTTVNNPSAFMPLSGLIQGWQIILPLIQKGGRVKMVIPSSFAWSCNGNGAAIPPNSPVYFDITLSDVN